MGILPVCPPNPPRSPTNSTHKKNKKNNDLSHWPKTWSDVFPEFNEFKHLAHIVI